MKKLLLLLVLLPTLVFAQKTPQGQIYNAKILRVNDGDTVVISAPFLPKPLKPELAVRIFGVDTPEKGGRAKCSKENELGKAASLYTKNLVKLSQRQQVVIYDWDKFGGRILGDIILDGRSLRDLLIESGYAREYHGEAKASWCN